MQVRGLADAGFFLDLPDLSGIRCWPRQLISLFNISGYETLSKRCLQRYSEPWRCLFPENFADEIRTPTFLAHSYYDSSELGYTLRLDCCPGGCEEQRACDSKEMRLFEGLREQHLKGWKAMLQRSQHGIWAPACG